MNTQETTKPNCYDCIHRRNVPGSCHSACAHPQADLVGMLTGENPLGIRGNAHGIRSGWFMWPVDFDPVWLESCKGFEAKQQQEQIEAKAGAL